MSDSNNETLVLREGFTPHSSHWGAFSAKVDGERLIVEPSPLDPDPSPLLGNFADVARHRARIARPMFRKGWLDNGPGPDDRRGRDKFVALEWPEAIERLSAELGRVYATHGASSVFGGSYGWSSAGRFHHAQSQVHRFLNTLGGYVRSVNSYSAGAAHVILPHIVGPGEQVGRRDVSWNHIEAHTDIILAFGGMAAKNSNVSSGGVTQHVVRRTLERFAARGQTIVSVSPLRDDMPPEARAEWIRIIPGTDVAMMLGLAHTIVTEGFHDRDFLARFCVGFDVFQDYLLGKSDGVAKTASWASAICGVPESTIVDIARRMRGARVLITVSQSLQRAQFGEQPVWMGLVLASLLGQVGLLGGGFAYGLGSVGNAGKPSLAVPLPVLSQGQNAVSDFIPVARIADLLLNPGAPFDYNGKRYNYADIKLVYWAGGNPFHHHQDLNRLRRAIARPETVVVHESAWTGMARHADIVLPTTLSLERADMGAAQNDPYLIAMHQVLPPFAQARDDYAIFTDLAKKLGCDEAFTEGRTADEWIRFIYERTRTAMQEMQLGPSDFEEFWAKGILTMPLAPETGGSQRAFRLDPVGAPLPTPSGKIEIFSKTIAGFGYDDCPGHPVWLAPTEGNGTKIAARFPIHLIANQPKTRLHSQLDFGATSQSQKVKGREPARINPADAAKRGIVEGDIVRLFNDRGACLAGALVTEDVMPGVVQIATGAWYDPLDPGEDGSMCVHGNPNILTWDIGTSKLAQGCSGQHTLIEFEKFEDELPPIRAYDPP